MLRYTSECDVASPAVHRVSTLGLNYCIITILAFALCDSLGNVHKHMRIGSHQLCTKLVLAMVGDACLEVNSPGRVDGSIWLWHPNVVGVAKASMPQRCVGWRSVPAGGTTPCATLSARNRDTFGQCVGAAKCLRSINCASACISDCDARVCVAVTMNGMRRVPLALGMW